MNKPSRPFALSIAGFDPSGGAGILADIKTMESCHVYGLGVCSAITFQNDEQFLGVEWISEKTIIQQADVLLDRFQPMYVKIGLVENMHILLRLLRHIRTRIPGVRFIWDPILRASAGYTFHTVQEQQLLMEVCREVYLLTPNLPEALELGETESAELNARKLSELCNVFLKGGHRKDRAGEDILMLREGKHLNYGGRTQPVMPKHGSGCILSSAITAFLAKGADLPKACLLAKEYTLEVLDSNETLLGFHNPSPHPVISER
ncbi:MAG: hydroxymethylpyrimidine/phosphomethylpyrimidine kinase [Bacteroidia bacterium]